MSIKIETIKKNEFLKIKKISIDRELRDEFLPQEYLRKVGVVYTPYNRYLFGDKEMILVTREEGVYDESLLIEGNSYTKQQVEEKINIIKKSLKILDDINKKKISGEQKKTKEKKTFIIF